MRILRSMPKEFRSNSYQRRRVRSRWTVGLVLMAASGIDIAAGAAQAQQLDPAVRQACMGDYRTLCSGVQPGGGRVLACLKQNAADLSQDCRKALAGAKGTR